LIDMDRRRLIATGLAGATALAGCDRREGHTFLAADMHPADYPTVAAVEEMGRLLVSRSGGRFSVKVYAGGQLGGERDTLEITTFGGLDLNRVNLAPFNTFAPLTVVPALPFLFRDIAHMRHALDGAAGEEILLSLEQHGVVGLCFYDSGDRNFYTTRRPIVTPRDLRGLKIRVPNSDLYIAMVRALGADATPISLGEVYQALVQGVIDGAENNWPSYQSGRHFEVARYYSLTQHVIAPEILVMSRARWRKLSADERDLVRSCAQDSVPFMRRLWDARVQASRDVVLASGVMANAVEDPAAFSALMRPVWESFVTSPDQRRLVDTILSL